jgi:FkbM family methyltransferase
MRPRDLRDYLRLRRLVANPGEVLRFRGRREAGARLTVRLRSGPELELRGDHQDHGIFRALFLDDEYRLDRLADSRLDTVFDLGANVGLFAARVAPRARRVICLEPVPENFDCLARNVAGWPHVETHRLAVSDRSGTVRLFPPEIERGSGLYSTQRPAEGGFDVDALTLDDVFERFDVARCDLLKIDVEGAEYAILHAASRATLAAVRRIHGEYHDVDADDPRTRVGAFAGFLESHGFRVDLQPSRRAPNYGLFFAAR